MKRKTGLRLRSGRHFQGLLLLVALLLAGVLAGLLVEGLYELNVCRRELKGGNKIGIEKIDRRNIQIEEAIINENVPEGSADMNATVVTGTSPVKRIHITIPERYINKLCYNYNSDGGFTAYTSIHTKNIYKNPEVRELQDICRMNLNESILNIKDYVTEIIIDVPTNVEISNITIDNGWDWNWYRVAYVGTFVFLILFIICFRKIISQKIELGFLVLSLGCGLLFIAVQPPECITWDEHIHFAKVFDWFENGVAERTESELYLYHYQETEERAPFTSKEEKALQIQYLNAHDKNIGETYERNAYTWNALGELHMALVVKLGEFLGMSFYSRFILGKIANLFLYTLLIYWAIKIIPAGKKFLTTISLMPTLMLQSTCYTYDIVVVSFLALGIALIFREYFHPEKRTSWVRLGCISAICVIGSCPKQVYIPLLASLLALPERKFKSRKSMLFCKGFLLLICIAVILTLLLPAVGGSVEGDARGGNTDVTAQLNMVFGHPFAYFRIFLTDVVNSFNSYVFDASCLTSLAYADFHPFEGVVSLLCLGVALTEKKPAMPLPRKNMLSMKILIAVILLGTIGLIWSALYIVFTPVGNVTIAGVQARYYIPLLLPGYMLFYTHKVEARYNETTYNTIMLLIILWLAHGSIYQNFFVAFCR